MKKLALLLAIFMLIGCLAGCAEEKPNEGTVTPSETSGESSNGSSNKTPNPNAGEGTDESTPYSGEFAGSLEEERCTAEEHKMTSVVENEADCENQGQILHTCSICGWNYQEVVDPVGHDYTPASCEFDAYCNRCHMVVESATGHSTDNGLCENCGAWIEGNVEPSVEQDIPDEEEGV